MENRINASIAIQVLPKGEKGEVVKIVDEIIKHIKSKNLKTIVCPFETVIEGELNELMNILYECIIKAKDLGLEEFMSYIKIAYNAKGVLTIDEKISKHN